MRTSYDVRIWTIREHETKARKGGKPVCTYRVRWRVAKEEFGESFKTKGLAEGFRSKLMTHQREGVAFDVVTGLPEPMAREINTKAWYEHAIAFVDMKWSNAAAKQRMSIAEALANVTLALLKTRRGAPADAVLRRALYGYSFNKARRAAGPPPEDLAVAVRWLAANTVNLNDLQDAALVRDALDALSRRQDGKQAAANTIARKRAVFYGALRYAVELRLLPEHPMDNVQWVTPKSDDEVDRRSVVSPEQALSLLSVVANRHPRLLAFFACLYYAALRPAEALHLRIEDCELPEEGWGMLRQSGSTQHVGEGWGDDSTAVREDRELKHRAKKAVRPVPAAPPLVRALRGTSQSTGTRLTADCSSPRGTATVRCRKRRTRESGGPRDVSACQRTNSGRRSRSGRTTCVTLPSRCGSTRAYRRPRSPSGPGAACTCC
jgi:integrase